MFVKDLVFRMRVLLIRCSSPGVFTTPEVGNDGRFKWGGSGEQG